MTGRLVVMGVSGSGKLHNGAMFFDGGDLHPDANTDKMTRGAALRDGDCAPWLERIGGTLRQDGTVMAGLMEKSA